MAAFRICIVLTALRRFSDGDTDSVMYCEKQDLEIALSIIETSVEHMQLLYSNLPAAGTETEFKLSHIKRKLLEELPNQFQRKTAIEIGKQLNIGESTIDKLLKSIKGVLIEEDEENGYGWYRKVTM